MNWRGRLKEPGAQCLLAAWLLAWLACLPLHRNAQRDTFTHIAVLDITRSMNVEDYRQQDRPVSRLEFAKASLRHALAALPCGSRLGLGVFTERRPFLLFEPIEVCAGYAAIDAAIEQIDWRMAWEADSRIADSLRNSLELLKDSGANLIFLTDGHEAPPVNPRYRPNFAAYLGKAKGVIVGVGGMNPVPIPKFNERGERIGVYGEDEVMQRSTFGEPETAPELLEGYNARNNPFGNAPAGGTEHLSSLKEDYLRQLSRETGLGYQRLETPDSLRHALTQSTLATPQTIAVDLRWIPAALALLALAILYSNPFKLMTGANKR